MCLSSSSQFLVSGGLDHCVHIWDLKTKRLHRSLKVRPHTGQVSNGNITEAATVGKGFSVFILLAELSGGSTAWTVEDLVKV